MHAQILSNRPKSMVTAQGTLLKFVRLPKRFGQGLETLPKPRAGHLLIDLTPVPPEETMLIRVKIYKRGHLDGNLTSIYHSLVPDACSRLRWAESLSSDERTTRACA